MLLLAASGNALGADAHRLEVVPVRHVANVVDGAHEEGSYGYSLELGEHVGGALPGAVNHLGGQRIDHSFIIPVQSAAGAAVMLLASKCQTSQGEVARSKVLKDSLRPRLLFECTSRLAVEKWLSRQKGMTQGLHSVAHEPFLSPLFLVADHFLS